MKNKLVTTTNVITLLFVTKTTNLFLYVHFDFAIFPCFQFWDQNIKFRVLHLADNKSFQAYLQFCCLSLYYKGEQFMCLKRGWTVFLERFSSSKSLLVVLSNQSLDHFYIETLESIKMFLQRIVDTHLERDERSCFPLLMIYLNICKPISQHWIGSSLSMLEVTKAQLQLVPD